MHTPSPKFFCPSCHRSYETDQPFCGRCGADMQHVSGLAYAAQTERFRKDRSGSGSGSGSGSDSDRATAELDVAWKPPVMERRAEDGRDDWLGRVVDSRYRVREVIGSGGMGVVYKVEHQRMGKIAAMKVLHQELANDPDVVIRFRREAEAVSRLTHPNTVQVFDFGTTRGALYLIMEYVRGTDLGTLVKRDGPIEFERAAPLFAQICAALAEAHALGVIHRDLKPENILVTRTHSGRDYIKVLDFGLAKLMEREELSDITDRGSIVGTPYYMSPEQIRDDKVDARSDIYSLGALMYRVLTGEPPYTAKNPVGVLTKHLTADLVPPSICRPDLAIDGRVDALIARAMAKDPVRRYQDINELVADIEAAYTAICGSLPSGGMPGATVSAVFTASSSGPTVAPVAANDVDYGMVSSARLHRSDIDNYERRMRRRHWIRIAVVPTIVVIAAAAALYLVFFRPKPPRTSEQEPNNELDTATLIATDSEVTGHIGKRISKRVPDRDYYQLAQALPPGAAITATVTALPNVDLELMLYDSTGQLLVQRNEGGVGHGERIRSYRTSKRVALLVSEAMPEGPRLPTENVSDAYTLTVHFDAPAAAIEFEPNDGLSDALTLAVDAPITGYLDRRFDSDTFVFAGQAGPYTLHISGASKVPLTWELGSAPPRRDREAAVDLTPGNAIVLRRSDRELPGDQQLPGADEPYALRLTRRP